MNEMKRNEKVETSTHLLHRIKFIQRQRQRHRQNVIILQIFTLENIQMQIASFFLSLAILFGFYFCVSLFSFTSIQIQWMGRHAATKQRNRICKATVIANELRYSGMAHSHTFQRINKTISSFVIFSLTSLLFSISVPLSFWQFIK